jgi:hypothetical protein
MSGSRLTLLILSQAISNYQSRNSSSNNHIVPCVFGCMSLRLRSTVRQSTGYAQEGSNCQSGDGQHPGGSLCMTRVESKAPGRRCGTILIAGSLGLLSGCLRAFAVHLDHRLVSRCAQVANIHMNRRTSVAKLRGQPYIFDSAMQFRSMARASCRRHGGLMAAW